MKFAKSFCLALLVLLLIVLSVDAFVFNVSMGVLGEEGGSRLTCRVRLNCPDMLTSGKKKF